MYTWHRCKCISLHHNFWLIGTVETHVEVGPERIALLHGSEPRMRMDCLMVDTLLPVKPENMPASHARRGDFGRWRLELLGRNRVPSRYLFLFMLSNSQLSEEARVAAFAAGGLGKTALHTLVLRRLAKPRRQSYSTVNRACA